MRFLLLLALVSVSFCHVHHKQNATIINIQLDRCPTDNYLPTDIIEFKINETGKISIFVVAKGSITLEIKSNGEVFGQLDGTQTYNGTAGGVILTREFKVYQQVRTSKITIIISGEEIKETIYVITISTIGITRPKPIEVQDVVNTEVTCGPPDGTNATAAPNTTHKTTIVTLVPVPTHLPTATKKPTTRTSTRRTTTVKTTLPPVTDSPSVPTTEKFPNYTLIETGQVAVPDPRLVRLSKIQMRRNNNTMIDEYFIEGKYQVIEASVENIESGQIVFFVDGEGDKFTVAIKSVEHDDMTPLEYQVTNGVAAFPYYVEYENSSIFDRWIARIKNEAGQVLYVYVKVLRDLI